ncbi:MAG: ABC-F family ATP-binding cassette domain-containing protein [Candidatus Latescibacterota bacterium]
MSLVRLHDVTLRYDGRAVLHHVFFRLAAGERVGLIGRNGSGKTTLLRLILGRLEATEGTVEVEREARLGYFSQFSELAGQRTVVAELEALFPHVQDLETELRDVEEALGAAGAAPRLDALLRRQATLLEEMQRLDGWGCRNRIDTVLSRLGFSPEHRGLPVERLSGGWRNRAALARILLEDPDVLLLDEPTNYLDIDGLAWLEAWLLKVRGALVVVSHDRHFLDHVATRIVEVENHQLEEYPGNFTRYVQEKPTRLKVLQGQYQHEEELLAWEAEVLTGLDPDDTVSHAVNVAPLADKAQRRQVHRFLELMQFAEIDLTRRIGTLSGGQQARVALAMSLLSGAWVVLLDEPTNHLDVTSIQVMERALVHFPGAVVVASHDRFFIDKVANRLLVFAEEGVARLVEANWTLYQAGVR